jgi:hypothetical protein
MEDIAIPCIDLCQMLCQMQLHSHVRILTHSTLPHNLDSQGERGIILVWYI